MFGRKAKEISRLKFHVHSLDEELTTARKCLTATERELVKTQKNYEQVRTQLTNAHQRVDSLVTQLHEARRVSPKTAALKTGLQRVVDATKRWG